MNGSATVSAAQPRQDGMPLRQRPVQWLLAASFLVTLSRAVTLPFIAIYLAAAFRISATEVGGLLTVSLVCAALAGVYGGWLVDRCRRMPLLLGGVAAAAAASASVPWLGGAIAALAALTLANAALAVIDVGIKAAFAALLDEAGRAKAFSARYVVSNVGYAVGPLIGSALVGQGEAVVFVVSGLFCALALLPLVSAAAALGGGQALAPRAGPGFAATLAALRHDKALIAFTLGGLLLAVVYGRFSSYLALYLSSLTDPALAYRMVGQAITVNAVVVIALQYIVGSRLDRPSLLRWQALGSVLLAAGLAGFMLSTDLPVWLLAMLVFTLGEIIVVPAAYLFIDHIAPDTMKGVYYGVQNLALLGSAASPLLCGLLLDAGWGQAMFVALIACTALSWACYAAGVRAAAAPRL